MKSWGKLQENGNGDRPVGCSQEFSSSKPSGQDGGLAQWNRIQASCAAQGPGWGRQTLTRHELVWLVPLRLTVVQGPQIDDHVCVLGDDKLANSDPDKEKEKE